MAVLFAFGGGGTKMYMWLRDLRESHKRMEEDILENREIVKEVVKANQEQITATRALVHYIKWLAEEQTGKKPPPPVE